MPWWGWAIGWGMAVVIFCVGWWLFNYPLRDDEDRRLEEIHWREKVQEKETREWHG